MVRSLCFLSAFFLMGCPSGGGDKDSTGDTSDTDDPVDLESPDELLLSAYDNNIWVIDVTDPVTTSLVTRVNLTDRATSINWPAVNADRSRFFFAQPDGIYGCDAPDCDTLEKITPDWPDALFDWFDVSPTGDLLAFQVWENYGAGENDIYTMKQDGSEMTRVLAVEEEYPLLSNGDQFGFWGAGEVAFSPDGARIAVNTCGHCASDDKKTPPLCLNDFYSVIYTMNIDGSDRVEENLLVGECYFNNLSWAGNDSLYYFRYDAEDALQRPTRFTDGIETELGGETLDDAVRMLASPNPADEALYVNPGYTGDARHHGITADSIEPGTLLEVANPESKGELLSVFSWFRWQR